MAKKERVFAFLDTNIFLEYTEFTQIDWRKITNSKTTCLMITRVNMQELDDFKYDPKSQRRQQRSRTIVNKIRAILKEAGSLQAPVPQRPGVSLMYLTTLPDLSNYPELRSNANDDQMIASILDFQRLHSEIPKDSIVLITGDTGPEFLAHNYGIQAIDLPESYLLAPEPNQTEKRLQQLERRIVEIEQQRPHPVLEVEGEVEPGLMLVNQAERNLRLADFLKTGSPRLLSSIQTVRKLYERSDRKQIDRRLNSPFGYLPVNYYHPLEVSREVKKQICGHLVSLDIEHNMAWLTPVDVYSDIPPIHFAAVTLKGDDARWYEAVHALQDVCEEDAELRFSAISESTHVPIRLRLSNTGGSGLKEVGIDVTSERLELSYMLPQFKTPRSDRDNAAPAFKHLSSDAKPPVYERYKKLYYSLSLLRPREVKEIDLGFAVAPDDVGRFSLIISVRADNLADPLERQLELEFNETVLDKQQEADNFKRLFDV